MIVKKADNRKFDKSNFLKAKFDESNFENLKFAKIFKSPFSA